VIIVAVITTTNYYNERLKWLKSNQISRTDEARTGTDRLTAAEAEVGQQ